MTETGRKRVLEVTDLEKSYSMVTPEGKEVSHFVLKGISFDVYQGEFIGIMGASGCGKTTLLKTIGMLEKPTGGQVFYKGESIEDIYGETLARIRRTEIAFIFQDYYLMDSLTVKENIMLPLILNEENISRSERTAVQVAGQFGIGQLLGKKPYELSGGEKQRTAIFRAMAENPELIFADEPTGNLDSNSSLQVIKTLKEIKRTYGKTIIMVTHDPKIASYCDRVLLLKDGVILDELKKEGAHKSFYLAIIRKMSRL